MSPTYSSPKRKRTREHPPSQTSRLSHLRPNPQVPEQTVQQPQQGGEESDSREASPLTPPSSSPAAVSALQRSATPQPSEMRLNTSIPGVAVVVDEGSNSPRTKVAYHFQGLQLEDGGEVSKLSLDMNRRDAGKMTARTGGGTEDDEENVRKRMKVLTAPRRGRGDGFEGARMEIPETPDARRTSGAGGRNGVVNGKQFSICIGPERTIDPLIEEKARGVVLQNEVDPVIFKGSPVSRTKGSALGRAYPSINRLSDSKSRAKKRSGTPPPALFGAADASFEMREAREIVDEDRAAMTWHDDEITGHNPDDPEDDGEGINGIGFRPTPAEAYARTQKRRAQMAEYKNREAREARAKRNENRRLGRGSGESFATSREEKEVERRVRFMEAEKMIVVSTS